MIDRERLAQIRRDLARGQRIADPRADIWWLLDRLDVLGQALITVDALAWTANGAPYCRFCGAVPTAKTPLHHKSDCPWMTAWDCYSGQPDAAVGSQEGRSG